MDRGSIYVWRGRAGYENSSCNEINYFWVLFYTYCRFKKREFRTLFIKRPGWAKYRKWFLRVWYIWPAIFKFSITQKYLSKTFRITILTCQNLRDSRTHHYKEKNFVQPKDRKIGVLASTRVLGGTGVPNQPGTPVGSLQSLSPASKFAPTSCRKDRDPLLRVSVMTIIFFINFSAVKNIYDN